MLSYLTKIKNVVIGNFSTANDDSHGNKLSTLPLLGKIAAGTPIEAIQDNDLQLMFQKK